MFRGKHDHRTAFHRLYPLVVQVCLALIIISLPAHSSGHSSSYSASGSHSAAAPSEPVVELFDQVQDYPLNRKLRFLENKNGEYTTEQIISGEMDSHFSRSEENVLNFGYTDSVIWVKIPIHYRGQQQNAKYWFEINTPLLGHAALFIKEKNNLIRKYAGYETPLSERDIAYPTRVFELTFQPDQKVELFVQLSSDLSLHIPMNIYSAKGMTEKFNMVTLLYALCLGATLIMVAYNVFVLISVREKEYFYYVLYISFYLISLLGERVHGLQLLGSVPAFLDQRFLPTYVWITFFFAFTMARYFLNAPKVSESLDWFIKIYALNCLVCGIISLFTEFTLAVQWGVIGTIINTLAVCACGLFAIIKRLPGSGAFFVAWLFNFAGLALYALAVSGYISFNPLTWNAPQLGIICQVLLLSFALSNRIKTAQKNALNANALAMKHLQRYRSLFDHAVEGVFQISLRRRFIDANPAMVKLLGYNSYRQMAKDTPDALAACYNDPETLEQVINSLENGNPIANLETRYTTHSGEERWAISSLRAVEQEGDQPLLLEGSLVDITEEKEKEKLEKERQQDRIHRKVAEASAKAKTRFLANMSHEIRTPLTAIIGYSESMLDDTMSEQEKKSSLTTVIRSGKHLLELINDILDHSKIDANKLEVEIVPVSVVEILDEVKDYLQSRVQEKGLEFTIQYDFPLPETIQTDPTRLKQILLNLCSNAIKFTDRGSIRITVRCDQDEEKILVRVVDTGIGLKPEQMSHLFDPFAQATPSITREYGGTGLGLNISRRLAELLGGTIRVSSTYGQGSEFELSIATGKTGSTRLIRNAGELKKRQTSVQALEIPKLKGRILYAEDNVVNRKLIEILVTKTGATLKTAVNGAEALKMTSDEQFDLILMDIQMPIMDGKDATIAIRKSGNTTPIVALTANIMAEDIREYKEAGCNDCLSKPVDKKRLYATLSHYLEAAKKNDDPRQLPGSPPDIEKKKTKQAQGAKDGLQPIIDRFLASLPEYITKLNACSKRNEWQEVQKIVHQIKGVAGSVGYPDMTEKAGLLDIAIKKGRQDDYARLLAHVLKECQDAVNAVEDHHSRPS
ncbi:MAG: histidine kinase [Gammaproteobacteria bacterium]|nr:MAG: histidine kinase [Pseudomonadota bacterium]PIE37976.1 MAG: histidine kinase [Gammaproteobacteria bacterium]